MVKGTRVSGGARRQPTWLENTKDSSNNHGGWPAEERKVFEFWAVIS